MLNLFKLCLVPNSYVTQQSIPFICRDPPLVLLPVPFPVLPHFSAFNHTRESSEYLHQFKPWMFSFSSSSSCVPQSLLFYSCLIPAMHSPLLDSIQAPVSDLSLSTMALTIFGGLSINGCPETNLPLPFGLIGTQEVGSSPFGHFEVATLLLQSCFRGVTPGFHDEVDMEFLGTKPGEPYTLQTNVYVRGSGDGRIIGREMKFHLWFDPTAAFHNYAILWNQREIIFMVDDVPIRRYAKWIPATFPQRPMWLYGSIWDASSWATDDGKYRADYRFQPFVARFTRFVAHGCAAGAPLRCRPPASSPAGFGLSRSQRAAMLWAQRRSLVYDYCRDPKRDHSLTPECRRF